MHNGSECIVVVGAGVGEEGDTDIDLGTGMADYFPQISFPDCLLTSMANPGQRRKDNTFIQTKGTMPVSNVSHRD